MCTPFQTSSLAMGDCEGTGPIRENKRGGRGGGRGRGGRGGGGGGGGGGGSTGKVWRPQGGGKKQAVSYAAPSEPAFLQRIKAQVGYKAPATIDAKRQHVVYAPDDDDSDDEGVLSSSAERRPVVVQLGEGQLSEADVDLLRTERAKEEETKKIQQGDITFRKPEKRSAEADDSAEGSSAQEPKTSSKTSSSSSKARDESAKRPRRSPPPSGPPAPRLLSFADEEEED